MPLTRQQLTTFAVVTSSALAAGGIATAATKTTSKSATARTASGTTGTTGADGGGRGNANETVLTGEKLKSASDAAIAANPGATVERASTEDPADANGAAYEVKITKKDGTRAEVLEDSSFKVLSTKADMGRGGHGRGGRGRGGNPNETALTGDDLATATAAAKDAVAGATVERASTEDPAEGTGAKYEVHTEKADGSHVTVLLDSSFKLIKTVADEGPGGHRGHR